MDHPFSYPGTAARLQRSGNAASSGISEESPFTAAPVIREVIRAAASPLMFETGFLRKNVDATAPCFAIRTRGFDDLSQMIDALPREVWELVSGTLPAQDIQTLFSTCKEMKSCLDKYIDKAEQQYIKSAKKICDIARDNVSSDESVRRKLNRFLDRHAFVTVSFSEFQRQQEVLTALNDNRSIKLLSINARNVGVHIRGINLGWSFCNLSNAVVELDLADNNFWSDHDFDTVFSSAIQSNSMIRLNLDRNNFRGIQRSLVFFNLIFQPRFRVRSLSMKGTRLGGFLSDFGMSLLAHALMRNVPHALETIDLGGTLCKPGPVPYPKIKAGFVWPLQDVYPEMDAFHAFASNALKDDKKSGLQLIIEALGKNTTITAINLSLCEIDDKVAEIIAGSLHENVTLQKLDLGENSIKSKGIKALGKAIGQHPSLQFLSLSANQKIEKKGWIDFFSALSGNTRLRRLDVSSCAIGDKEVAALAAMLKTNDTMKELILSYNRITVKGITDLAGSLNGHRSLCLLELVGNTIPLEQASLLQDLVRDGIQVRLRNDD